MSIEITPLSLYEDMLRSGEIKPDEEQRRVMIKLQELHQDLHLYRPRGLERRRWLERLRREALSPLIKGVYLHGPVGRGKTLAMQLFFEALPTRKKKRVHFHEFMQDVHDFLFDSRSKKQIVDDALPLFVERMLDDVWVLCFDEFQVTDVADAMLLKRLFSMIFSAGIIIVATSNTAPAQLYENGLQRDQFLPFIDQIYDYMTVIEINSNEDYREQIRGNARLYLSPVSSQHRQQFQEMFSRATHGETTHTLTLEVKSRRLSFDTYAGGYVYAPYAALIREPLGVNDFLEIAGKLKGIFLHDVPAFLAENTEEARRFINLVDSVYDTQTRLAILAEVPLKDLYPKDGMLADDFQRTTSRLREMRHWTLS